MREALSRKFSTFCDLTATLQWVIANQDLLFDTRSIGGHSEREEEVQGRKPMNSKELERHVIADLKVLEKDFVHDAKEEIAHVVDPSQCGVVVQNHFNGLVIALYVFIFLCLATAGFAIYLYTHH